MLCETAGILLTSGTGWSSSPFFLEALGICTEIPGPKRSLGAERLVWVNPCSSFGFRLRPDVLTRVVVMTDVVSSRILGSLGMFPICSKNESSIHTLPSQSLSGFAFQLFIWKTKHFLLSWGLKVKLYSSS